MKYWSKYDADKRIASPFYHELHIAQLTVMHELFGNAVYKEYLEKWRKNRKSILCFTKAFVRKTFQKLFE